MRYLLLASAAALALAAGPAFAGGPTPFPIFTGALQCGDYGVSHHVPQVQCGANIVDSDTQNIDNLDELANTGTSTFGGNTQTITQTQTGSFPHKHTLKGTVQLQLGQNHIVGDSEGNDQSITQDQSLTDNGHNRRYQSLIQYQSALNSTQHDGDDNNTQSITQTQTATISNNHLDQLQGASNKVVSGDGNTQSITQSQTLTLGGSGGGSKPPVTY